jgi:Glycosyltransferase
VGKLRIAFFTDTFYPQINGVSNTLSYLSRYLQTRNIEHIFFAPDYGSDSDECAGLPVKRFKGFCPMIYPECRIAFAPLEKITGLLEDFAPDVVHIVTELSLGLVGLRAATALNIPVVMSYHTNFDRYLHFYHLTYFSEALWLYMKWFHSFALVNLCPSRDTLESMRQRGFQNLDIWSRGIDLERFRPSHFSPELREKLGAGDKTVFLYVGRISVEKGLDVLMQSIRSVSETHGDRVQFWITGDGPYLKEIASLALPNVVFTGGKRGAELAQIYASADAFVFPSGTETFGNVLLEAMASGLPTVCTDSGGVTDYTVHGENAVVCRYGDPDSLSRAMIGLLDPDLRSRIRSGALRTAESRSWNAIFDTLIHHYAAAKRTLSRSVG